MNTTEFLRLNNIDLPLIVASAQSSIGLGPDDLLLAVGSLAEGLGNIRSDFDLILVTPREAALVQRHDIALRVGTCLFDIQVIPLSKICALLTRFETWVALPWDVTRIADIGVDDRRLLHRLLHCSIVYEGEASNMAVLQCGKADLARLKLQVARHTARTIQVDMAGNLDAEDYASLFFAAQDLLGHAVDALVAGHYLTNPIPKWRNSLLQRLPRNWETSVGIRPTGMNAAQLFWSLQQTPERPDRRSTMQYALRVMTFARAVFAWAERQLLDPSPRASVAIAWPKADRTHEDVRLPHLNFDVDFWLADDRVILGRLNHFVESLELTPEEFEIVLLFDGVTTAREAELVVRGSYARGAEHRLVEGVMVRVNAAGFSICQE